MATTDSSITSLNSAFNLGFNGITDLASSFSTLFGNGNEQYQAQEASYSNAAELAAENAEIEPFAAKVKEAAASRKVQQTIGAQKAAVGASGFQESGTALQLLRDTTQQGALEQGVIAQQGAMNQQQYEVQEQQFQNEAKAASEAASQNTLGAMFKGVAGLAQLGMAGFEAF